ncbi:succinyl-diaminopimelate desuccinylase [mine drainage metagenome]|uniref:Succinyl-diaminopimelate desuccinylase n=1 Tax=mine drainage metagenome TaxID=410659 RepID=A0A1J5PJZ7_9ZZZZ
MPTYLCYGHYDVQPEGEGWTEDPFEPTTKDGWLYGRGSSDDKGQFLTLLKAAELMVAHGELPINLVFLGDGEEEILGEFSSSWLREHSDEFAGAIVFDSSFLDHDTPVINISTRGLVYFKIHARTAKNDLHSGLAGGAAMNAFHELIALVDSFMPKDGRLADEWCVGATPPTEAELSDWKHLVSGAKMLSDQGGRPADPKAADEYYLRTWALPSLDIHGFAGGSPTAQKTIVVSEASVSASFRLAPGQDPETIIAMLKSKIETARTGGADFTLEITSVTPPSFVSGDSAIVAAGSKAFTEVFGKAPLVLRAGGTLPFIATLGELQIPFLLSGFHLPEGNAHGPDEKFLISHLYDGVRFVQNLFRSLSAIPNSPRNK